MSYFMIDVEADGPVPGPYSMISFGAVVVEPGLSRIFYGRLRPISDNYLEDHLAVTGLSRAEVLTFDEPQTVMHNFDQWISQHKKGKAMFISDNTGFDWMFISWYFHTFLGHNPFWHDSIDLGSLYKGLVADTFQNFKHLRDTQYTHNPVDDAKGNAEALLKIKHQYHLKISLNS
jgi:DNA polymerase III alpha subunit (gram-positive type)